MKDSTGTVVAYLPQDVAVFLLNEKRDVVFDLERERDVRIVIVPDPDSGPSSYRVERVRRDDREHASRRSRSFELVTTDDELPEYLGFGAMAPYNLGPQIPLAPPPPRYLMGGHQNPLPWLQPLANVASARHM